MVKDPCGGSGATKWRERASSQSAPNVGKLRGTLLALDEADRIALQGLIASPEQRHRQASPADW